MYFWAKHHGEPLIVLKSHGSGGCSGPGCLFVTLGVAHEETIWLGKVRVRSHHPGYCDRPHIYDSSLSVPCVANHNPTGVLDSRWGPPLS